MNVTLCREHAEVLGTMQTALAALGSVDPLEAPAEQPTRREFAHTLRLANKLIGQMHAHVTLLSTVSSEFLEDQEYKWDETSGLEENLLEADFGYPEWNGIDGKESETDVADRNSNTNNQHPDQDGDEGEGEHLDGNTNPDDSSLPDNVVVMTRLSKIWPVNFHEHTLTTMLITHMFSRQGSKKKQEDEGLRRLLTGYRETTTEELEELIEERIGQSVGDWEWHTDICREIDDDNNVLSCLLRREKYIVENNHGECLHGFVSYIIRTIHLLKFQIEWNKLSRENKSIYLDDIFKYLCHDDLRLIRAGRDVTSRIKKKRKQFAKKYQRKTTTRNYVLQLYKKFGCGILLDTAWDTPHDLTLGRTAKFGPLWNALQEELPAKVEEDGSFESVEEYLDDSRTRSLNLLEQLCHALQLEDDVWEWIRDFVTTPLDDDGDDE